jgi:tetratricopeptide (TPR) repeat protein
MSKPRATERYAWGSPRLLLLRVLCLFLGALSVPYPYATAQESASAAPDQLYTRRGDPGNAQRAAELWTAEIQRQPQNAEAAWKLARVDYWLGGHAASADAGRFFDDGVARARAAVALAPNRPEGHFWLAANMGALGERSSRAGLKYRGAIKEELETVLRLAPEFQQGSADRALGRWYAKVPRLLGGSRTEAEAHLRASLKYNPQSTASHFFLAELRLDQGRPSEARAELQRVIDAPDDDPEWDPENQEFKAKARSLMSTLK